MSVEYSPNEFITVVAAPPSCVSFPVAPVSLMQSRNFEFLRTSHRELADLGGFAEAYAHTDPASCLVKLRTFAEFLVKALFSHHRFELTYQSNLNDLLADDSFKSVTPAVVQDKLHLIRIKGNHAAHGTLHATTPSQMTGILKQKDTYAAALSELRAGWKQGHWMWFIFPQLAGLGFSSTAQFYAILSIDEAAAYQAHPVLGPRLIECCEALLLHPDRSARDILGSPDDLKLRSCATLFAQVHPAHPVFERILTTFYFGRPDTRTLELLAEQ